MKINKIAISAVAGLSAILALCTLSSCVKEEESPLAGSRRVALSPSISGLGALDAAISQTDYGTPVAMFDLKSEDGSIVIPVMVSESDGIALPPCRTAPTKGSLINDTGSIQPLSEYLDEITLSGYYTDNRSNLFTDVTAGWDGSAWSVTGNYYWPQSSGLDIYARANLPEAGSSVTVDNTNHSQTLDYTVPSDTDDQKDILMAIYSGTGNAVGEADILFHHPLTAVQFSRNAGTPEMTGITRITIRGVNYHGTATQTIENPAGFVWHIDDESTTVVQDNNGLPLEVHGDIDGDPFLLIPQEMMGGRSVELSVVVVFADHEIPLNTIIDETNWEPGKTYTYNIDFKGFVDAKVDVTSESEIIKKDAVFTNTGSRKAYVRAMAVGYITDTEGNIKSTWIDDKTGLNRGVFTVTSGTFGTGTWNTYWVTGPDGFWYYKQPLEFSGNESLRKTTPLFNKYSITNLTSLEKFELALSMQMVEWDSNKDYVKIAWGEEAAALLN